MSVNEQGRRNVSPHNWLKELPEAWATGAETVVLAPGIYEMPGLTIRVRAAPERKDGQAEGDAR